MANHGEYFKRIREFQTVLFGSRRVFVQTAFGLTCERMSIEVTSKTCNISSAVVMCKCRAMLLKGAWALLEAQGGFAMSIVGSVANVNATLWGPI